MRHRKSVKQLGRVRAQRKSLLRNLATDLIIHGSLTTTEAKAKVLRPYAEKLVTIAKTKPHTQAKSLLQGKVFGNQAPVSLLRKYKKQYADRSGGYIRLTKIGLRSGDKTRMVKVEWV